MVNTARETTPRAEGGADIDKMLNDKKFLEAFSAQKNLDVENLDLTEGNEDLKEKYEAFQESKKVSKELTKLCEDQIFKEAKIKLDKKEFEGIEKFLGEQVFENPKMIENSREQMAQFKELPETIAQQEAEFAAAKEALEKLKKDKKESKDKMHETFVQYKDEKGKFDNLHWYNLKKMWQKGKMETEYTRQLSEIDSENLRMGKIIDLKEPIIKDIKNLKDEFEGKFSKIRDSLFMEIEPVKVVFEKAREAAQNKIKELGDPSKDLPSSEEAAKYLQELKISAESKEGSGHNFLEGFEFKEGEDAEESLDEQIKGKIYEKLKNIITSTSLGSKPLADFEGKLSDLIYKEKIGSMKKDESKQFIVDKLKEIRKWHSILALDKTQNILLGRIIIKLEAGA